MHVAKIIIIHQSDKHKIHDFMQILAPLLPSFYRGIGLNYHRHAQDTKAAIPKNPIVFIKPALTTAGPMDPIVIPTICQDGQVDYEAELAVVIGKACKDVSKEEALDYVAGKSHYHHHHQACTVIRSGMYLFRLYRVQRRFCTQMANAAMWWSMVFWKGI